MYNYNIGGSKKIIEKAGHLIIVNSSLSKNNMGLGGNFESWPSQVSEPVSEPKKSDEQERFSYQIVTNNQEVVAEIRRIGQIDPFPWAGEQIDPAFEGIEFNFANSPGKPSEDYKEHANDPVRMAMMAAMTRYKQYQEKRLPEGSVLGSYKVSNKEKALPDWMNTALYKAQSTVFKDMSSVKNFLRDEAARERRKQAQ